MERFLEKIEEFGGGCWEWTGGKTRAGYGVFWYMKQKGNSILAHRLSYTVFKGDIPKGMQVLHSCDNPSCVNPKHLRVGTHSDNMEDKVARKGGVQSHCRRGHELSGDNVFINSKEGARTCKICRENRRRERIRQNHRQDRFIRHRRQDQAGYP